MRGRFRFGPRPVKAQYADRPLYDTNLASGEITRFKRVTKLETTAAGGTSFGVAEDRSFDLTALYAPRGNVGPRPVLVQMPTQRLAVSGPAPAQLSPPPFAAYAEVFIEDENIRWTADGATPADNRGEQERKGTTITLQSRQEIEGFRALAIDNVGALDPSLTARLTVVFYNGDPERRLWRTPDLDWRLTQNQPTIATPGSMSMAGDILAVGQLDKQVAGLTNAGAVEVYRFANDEWASAQVIDTPNPAGNGYFGGAVKVVRDLGGTGDDFLFVSALYESANSSGRLYVYRSTAGGPFTLVDSTQGANTPGVYMTSRVSGLDVNASGRVAVGGSGSNVPSFATGRVQTFYFNPANGVTTLQSDAQITGSTAALARTGFGVHWDGDRLVVVERGTRTLRFYGPSSATAMDATEQASITEAAGTSVYGASSALAGGIITVGDWSADIAGNDAGAVYVYAYSGAGFAYNKIQRLDGPVPGAQFGFSVDFDGTTLAVADRQQRIYIYVWDGSAFSLAAQVSTIGGATDLAIGGDKLAASDFAIPGVLLYRD